MIRSAFSSTASRRVGGACLAASLAAGLALTAAPGAEAAAAPAAPLAAFAPLGRSVSHRAEIVIPAGARHVGGSADGVGYSLTPAVVSPRTSICTLTVYDPTWVQGYEESNNVLASAGISCEVEVAVASITVAVYFGVYPYPLQNYTTTTLDDVYSLVGTDLWPISESGYYIAAAVGSVGSPVSGSFSEVTSDITYVTIG